MDWNYGLWNQNRFCKGAHVSKYLDVPHDSNQTASVKVHFGSHETVNVGTGVSQYAAATKLATYTLHMVHFISNFNKIIERQQGKLPRAVSLHAGIFITYNVLVYMILN